MSVLRRMLTTLVVTCSVLVVLTALVFLTLVILSVAGNAHMADRPDLDNWFGSLKSNSGLCCSFADGVSVGDVDWNNDGPVNTYLSGYRVRVTKDWPKEFQDSLGQWIDVPKATVLETPNKYGPAVVWPYIYRDATGKLDVLIRCFIPGAGT